MSGNDAGELADCVCGDVDCRLWIDHGFFPTDAKPVPTSAGASGKCSASPDHADIMETIQNAADDWQKQGYISALAEVRDMATVGRALMEALPEGYSYLNCPSEIVSDLQNERDEASTQASAGVLVEAAKALMARWPTDQHEGSPLYDEACALRRALSTTATPASDGVTGFCNKCGYSGPLGKYGTHNRPGDGKTCLYAASTPTPDRFGEAYRAGVEADLTWFSSQRHLSLEFYSPVYGDDDDQSYEWRVHKESGSINDREWEVVGRGINAAEAITAARSTIRALQPATGDEA